MPLKTWPKPFQYFSNVKTFLISVSAIISLFIAGIFLFHAHNVNEILIQSVKQQAESYANLIVLTRHWNAGYGGVYVVKGPGVASNRYLLKLGVDPDIAARDGKVLTLRNPAIMTREISELARDKGAIDIQFHMVSLRYLNPENSPDEFERQSLIGFERGATEAWRMDRTAGRPVFRYIRSLLVENECLNCHRRQGYKLNDVRGGISISIPTERLEHQMKANSRQVFFVAAITIALLLGILYFMTWKLVLRLDEVQKRLKYIAVTDELTGLKNRRYIMEHLEQEYQRAVRSDSLLSLVLLDIDHFKHINDTYGHAFGDSVLKTVADEMKSGLRPYDLLGRIGGEEFLIASPGSTPDDAAGLADRVLQKIRSAKIAADGQEISITVSAGVTTLDAQDATADALLARADKALYKAKQEGRNRVVTL